MSSYRDVFRALDAAGVRYVVVGGVAVVLRGHPRLTVDLDIVLDLERDNALRAVEALLACGLQPRLPVDARQFADPAVRRDWIENRHLMVFSFFDPEDELRVLDVFAESPLPFEELFSEATDVAIDDGTARVASLGHLIQMKRAAGRPKDLEDVVALEGLTEP